MSPIPRLILDTPARNCRARREVASCHRFRNVEKRLETIERGFHTRHPGDRLETDLWSASAR